MTKKIINLTEEEIRTLCKAQNCDTCPYIFYEARTSNLITEFVCLLHIGKIMESEVEVDAIGKR